MKSIRLAFFLTLMTLIWSVMQVQPCKAVSLDSGRITTLGLICAQNPGLSPSQSLFDVIRAEKKVVVYIGRPEASGKRRCGPCIATMNALQSLCARYPDVVFIYIDSEKYPSLRSIATVPELRFYKNGAQLAITQSLSLAALQTKLNGYYK